MLIPKVCNLNCSLCNYAHCDNIKNALTDQMFRKTKTIQQKKNCAILYYVNMQTCKAFLYCTW